MKENPAVEEKKSNPFLRFVKKHKILVIVVLALIAIIVPLVCTVPSEEALKGAIPQEFIELQAKKDSESYQNIGIMSALKMQKQINSADVRQYLILGVLIRYAVLGC